MIIITDIRGAFFKLCFVAGFLCLLTTMFTTTPHITIFRVNDTSQRSVISDIQPLSFDSTPKPNITLTTSHQHHSPSGSPDISADDSEYILRVNDTQFNLTYLNVDISAAAARKVKVAALLQSPVINNFPVNFPVNLAYKCANFTPEVIIIIPSARGNLKRRHNVRNGNQSAYVKARSNPEASDSAIMLFFIGQGKRGEHPHIAIDLDAEVNKFDDIVIADFEDIYANILKKHMAMMQWIQTFCPKAKYILRTDDDIQDVSTYSMISSMRHYKRTQEHFILGTKRDGDFVYRGSNPKWFVSKQEYEPSFWPPFVLGGAIGYPTSTVKLLHEAAKRIKTVWLDDVFVTGICASALGIPTYGDEAFKFGHR